MQPAVALKKERKKLHPLLPNSIKAGRKKNTVTYDKHIYGTVAVAFIGTARSLGEKLSICGYTLWPLAGQTSGLGVSCCVLL